MNILKTFLKSDKYECDLCYYIFEKDGDICFIFSALTKNNDHGNIYKDICNGIINYNKKIKNNENINDSSPLIINQSLDFFKDKKLIKPYIYILVEMHDSKFIKTIKKFFNREPEIKYFVNKIDVYTLKSLSSQPFENFANYIHVDPNYLFNLLTGNV